MSKEVKVGLAVIVGLLIACGVILARRMSGSGDGADFSAAGSGSNEAAAEQTTSGAGSSATAAAKTRPPTVLPAKPPSSGGAQVPLITSRITPRITPPGATGNPVNPYRPPPTAGPNTIPPLSPYGPYAHDALRPPATPVGRAPAPGASSPPGTAVAGGGAAAAKATLPNGRGNQVPSPGPAVGQPRSNVLRPTPPKSYAPSTDHRIGGGAAAAALPSYSGMAQAPYPTAHYSAATGARLVARPTGFANPGTYTPSPAATGVRRSGDEYVVQPNDSYWVISQKLYATGAYFKALAEHNRGRVPRENELAVGAMISAPSIAELEKGYPGLCPKPEHRDVLQRQATAVRPVSTYGGGRTYVVQEGDNLGDIARHELGQHSRWPEIWQLNRGVIGGDYNYVRPGTELILPGTGYTAPAAGPTDLMTGRPVSPPTIR